MPAATPVSNPDAVTVAMDVLVLDHVPPATVLETVMVSPRQTESAAATRVPAYGNELTTTDIVTVIPDVEV